MPILIDIQQVQARFFDFLHRVEAGEEILISRDGRPIARLTPFSPSGLPPRQPGGWEGRVFIADDFDTLPDDVIDAFYETKIDSEIDREAG